jgi:hypothetical protein
VVSEASLIAHWQESRERIVGHGPGCAAVVQAIDHEICIRQVDEGRQVVTDWYRVGPYGRLSKAIAKRLWQAYRNDVSPGLPSRRWREALESVLRSGWVE